MPENSKGRVRLLEVVRGCPHWLGVVGWNLWSRSKVQCNAAGRHPRSQSSVHKLEGEHDWPLAELVTTPPPEVEELTEMPILWTAAVVVAEAGALEEGLEGEKDRREILTAEGGAV